MLDDVRRYCRFGHKARTLTSPSPRHRRRSRQRRSRPAEPSRPPVRRCLAWRRDAATPAGGTPALHRRADDVDQVALELRHGRPRRRIFGEGLSDQVKKLTGEETIVSDLTYDLRSGSPDFVDRMVAATFAGMAIDAIQKGEHGQMTAINNGCYAMVGIPDPKLGPRRVEVGSMYNTERYRPTYDSKLGLPIFLTRA